MQNVLRARTSDKTNKQANKIRHTQTLTIKIVTIFPTTSVDCTFVNVFHILQTLSSWASFWSHGFFRKWIKTIKERKIINIMYYILSGGFWVRQAQREVVKIKFFDFSYWASSTPWGHVLSLKTFCRNPALSWAIRYSVFQNVKFTSSFEFVCGNPFSTFWHLMVKFG